jgi:hypothetical protein
MSILRLVKEQPDSTFEELLAALRKGRIRSSRSALWRFFERHNITFKKSLRAAEQRADVARARRRWIREQGLLDPAHLVFIDETAVSLRPRDTSRTAQKPQSQTPQLYSLLRLNPEFKAMCRDNDVRGYSESVATDCASMGAVAFVAKLA